MAMGATARRRHPAAAVSPAASSPASLSPAVSRDGGEQPPPPHEPPAAAPLGAPGTTAPTIVMAARQRRRRRRQRPNAASVTANQRIVYLVSFLLIAVSVALWLGVTHYHLLLFSTTTATTTTEIVPRQDRHGAVETASAQILSPAARRELQLSASSSETNSNGNDPHSLLRRRQPQQQEQQQQQQQERDKSVAPNPTIRHNHQHAIPNILIFTHRWNLLEQDLEALLPADVDADELEELRVLRDNVRNSSVALHPGAQVRFLTDADCRASLRRVPLSSATAVARRRHNNDSETTTTTTATLPQSSASSLQERLVRHFDREPQGMFKADLCRGAALYETGGLYLDADLGVRLNLFEVLRPATEFATVRVHRQSRYPGAFFQAFVAAAPRHPVLLRYVELFLDHYEGRLRPRIAKGPLGVLLLKRAYDEIQEEQQLQLQQQQQQQQQQAAELLVSANKDKETKSNDEEDNNSEEQSAAEVAPAATTATTTHLNATTELWQEALYLPELRHTLLRDVPPPAWGTRRACKFVVLARRSLPLQVPFYSRIAGSRMCPRHDDSSNNSDSNENVERGDAEDGRGDSNGDDEKDEKSDIIQDEDEEVRNSNPHQDGAAEAKER